MLRFSYKRIALTVFVFYAVLLFLWLKTRDGPLLYYQSADDDEESLQSIKNTTLGVTIRLDSAVVYYLLVYCYHFCFWNADMILVS